MPDPIENAKRDVVTQLKLELTHTRYMFDTETYSLEYGKPYHGERLRLLELALAAVNTPTSEDEPESDCEYIYDHTRTWSGNPNCRES